MPRPRFHKLPEARRRAILDTAAKAFAADGYAKASLNGILSEVGVSKGAAYYYFDGKADLFAAVVEDAWAGVADTFEADLGKLDAKSFWPVLGRLYARQVASFAARPWTWRAVKAVGPALQDPDAGPFLLERLAPMVDLLGRLRTRARRLGMLRRDLPEPLVMAMLGGVDDAVDGWLLAHPAKARDPKVVAAAFAALRQVAEGPRG